jgi:Rha family phage regulatory protein
MSDLVFVENGRVVTDSLTVAEVFGKEHRNVLADIDNQIEKLNQANEKGFSLLNFQQSNYTNERGRQYRKYLLTEDAFALVVMAYVTPEAMKFKVRFIEEFKRMKEKLERMSAPKEDSYMINDPIERAKRWIEEQEERRRIEQKLAIAEPKAEKHDKFIDASGLQGIKEVGKVLGIGEKKFFEFLRQVRILDGKNLPMQDYLNRGWFEVKESTIERGDKEDREDKSFNVAVTKVTAKGVSALSNVVEKYGGAKVLNKLKVKDFAGYVKAKQMGE